MSEALAAVIERATIDTAFRALLHSNPDRALAGYSLTAEERVTILSGDSRYIQALGVEPRVIKHHDNPAEPGDAWPSGPWAGSE